MWHDLKIDKVSAIERCAGEYTIRSSIFPYANMKIKIYESQERWFTGLTDLKVKRKKEGIFCKVVGSGATMEEALEDTLKNFTTLLQEEGYEDLDENDIAYVEYPDF